MFLLLQCNLTKVKHIQISFGNEHVAKQARSIYIRYTCLKGQLNYWE